MDFLVSHMLYYSFIVIPSIFKATWHVENGNITFMFFISHNSIDLGYDKMYFMGLYPFSTKISMFTYISTIEKMRVTSKIMVAS